MYTIKKEFSFCASRILEVFHGISGSREPSYHQLWTKSETLNGEDVVDYERLILLKMDWMNWTTDI